MQKFSIDTRLVEETILWVRGDAVFYEFWSILELQLLLLF